MDVVVQERCIDGLLTVCAREDLKGMGFHCQIGAFPCVITVAHNLPRLTDPTLVHGDPLLVRLAHFDDSSIDVEALVRFVDPCSDLAILDNSSWHCELMDLPDGTRLEEAYECLWCDRSDLKISTSIPQNGTSFPVHIYTVDHKWQAATAIVRDRSCPFIRLEHEDPLPPGTSGAPVFNDSGEVIGIDSRASSETGGGSVMVLLATALPRWALLRLGEIGRDEGDGQSKGSAS